MEQFETLFLGRPLARHRHWFQVLFADTWVLAGPISEISKEWLRDQTGFVTHEPFLFNTTIRENLTLAKHEATDAQLWAVLEAANAAEFIRSLPEQLDTVAGERGIRFSGGEKQRVAIARTILKRPPIMVFDEATSSLDSKSEQAILAAIKEISQEPAYLACQPLFITGLK